jgi:hypothetical protein
MRVKGRVAVYGMGLGLCCIALCLRCDVCCVVLCCLVVFLWLSCGCLVLSCDCLVLSCLVLSCLV